MKRAFSPKRGGSKLVVLLVLIFVVLGALYVWSSRRAADPEETVGVDLETLLIREQVAHWFKKDKLTTAREVLAPLVAEADASSEDLIRAATIEYAMSETDQAEAFLVRAEALDPNAPELFFLRGQMAREAGNPEVAVEQLRRAHEFAPEDLPSMYLLAQGLRDLDEFEEAEALLRQVVSKGIENAGSWYVSSLYTLERLLILDGREDETPPLTRERKALEEAGIGPLSANKTRLGTFGRIAPPAASGSAVPNPPTSLAFEPSTLDLTDVEGVLQLLPYDLDGDGRGDLLVRLADGLAVAHRKRDGWESRRIYDGQVAMVRAFDLDNEPEADLELLLLTESGLKLLHESEKGWEVLPVRFPVLPSLPTDIEPVDFDHEGDIDLLIAGDFGARLWRNDGAWIVDAETPGAFVDATETASLPSAPGFAWAAIEDFDGDNDVDLLLGGPEGLYLADSLRAGRFADESQRFPAGTLFADEPVIADFDGDARPDLFPVGGGDVRYWQQADASFAPIAGELTLPEQPQVLDLDLDGSVDLVWGNQAILAAGLDNERLVELFDASQLGASGESVVIEVDGDRRPDLVMVGDSPLNVQIAAGERGNSKSIVVRGNRSNKRGLGCIVEARSGATYRRIYYRGEPVEIGVGAEEKLDVIRITYPNGTSVSEIEVALDDGELIDDPSGAFDSFTEPADQIGSCPFLYTWNGEEFEFISDVLGITPLGLPMAPGVMVPPDHDEFVLVRGDQLKVQDGEFVMQFTEELREVTYLDRIRLDVVDHPEGTDVYPNELFKFPPFPEEHLHSVADPQLVKRAVGSDGHDWTWQLEGLDDEHAIPFDNQPPQFQGLAKPWFLELEFDPEALRDKETLRLVMTGWFFWSDASANMAAAGHPGVDFVPPIIQVPDGEGGWRATGPPVGFPAGKTKTMVIDVSDIGLQETPRLRIFCTLQLFWDRILLATDGDDAPRQTYSIEPVSAMLTRRGFSAPIATENPGLPARFDWEVMAEAPRWNPHPGKYTKLGECQELLHEVDDRYIIMGTGESLELRFDATGLPPIPEGYTRDYLVFLDGWAKDRDHNTIEALNVTPLPFHGMSGYPYTETESFPDTPEHQAWQAEWNTRDPEDWILPLSKSVKSDG